MNSDAGVLFVRKPVTEGKKRSSVSAWLQRNYPPGPCERCLEKCRYQIHHKDRNWRNNDRANLERLCQRCHSAEHAGDEAHAAVTRGWRTRKAAADHRPDLACAECERGGEAKWRDGKWWHGDAACCGSINVHGGFGVARL